MDGFEAKRSEAPPLSQSGGEDLYRDFILDHFKNPRNKGSLENYDIKATGANPFCGDEVEITLKLNGEGIESIKVLMHGCAISQASASMMAELLDKKSLEQTRVCIGFFKSKLVEASGQPWPAEMEDFEALEGVKNYPVRIKCAVLSWNTLAQALKEYESKGGREPLKTSHTEE